MMLQDVHGQILEAFSISAGLDYPGIGPEHSYFHEIKRATYVPVTDQEALEAFQLLSNKYPSFSFHYSYRIFILLQIMI